MYICGSFAVADLLSHTLSSLAFCYYLGQQPPLCISRSTSTRTPTRFKNIVSHSLTLCTYYQLPRSQLKAYLCVCFLASSSRSAFLSSRKHLLGQRNSLSRSFITNMAAVSFYLYPDLSLFLGNDARPIFVLSR